ncbi:MAG: hypothetical protein GY719_13295 [bacterium]|nr:hypothetical protein [bacterium]
MGKLQSGGAPNSTALGATCFSALTEAGSTTPRSDFVEMLREASLKVKFGKVAEAAFPRGSFPPSLPFLRTAEEFDPLADARSSPSFARALERVAIGLAGTY